MRLLMLGMTSTIHSFSKAQLEAELPRMIEAEKRLIERGEITSGRDILTEMEMNTESIIPPITIGKNLQPNRHQRRAERAMRRRKKWPQASTL